MARPNTLCWLADPTAELLDIDPYSHWLLVHGQPYLRDPAAFSHVAVISEREDDFETRLKTKDLAAFRELLVDTGDDIVGKLADLLPETSGRAGDPATQVHVMPLRARSIDGAALSGHPIRSDLAAGFPAQDEVDRSRRLVITAVIDDHVNVFHDRFAGPRGTRVDCAWFQDGPFGGDVAFGREFAKPEIDRLRASGAGEDAILRRTGLVEMAAPGANPLALRASHGTHVLDLAAGAEAAAADPNWRIVAVSLPSLVTFDTSGATLGTFFLLALQYVLRRAREIAEACGCPATTLVVNCSYGISGGPHDGTHFIERTIDKLVAEAEPAFDGIHVVLPAGNGNLDRGHAVAETDAKGERRLDLALPWRIQPADQTASYLEIWLPPGASDVSLEVRPPGELAALPGIRSGGAMLLSADGTAAPGQVLARVHRARVGERERILLAVAPTERPGSAVQAAPSGVWEVAVGATVTGTARIEAWIQRDISPIGSRVQGRQSYFDDPRHARFGPGGRRVTDDSAVPPGVVRHRGTLNGIATGPRTQVVAGYPGDLLGIDAAAYSGTGRPDGPCPDLAAPSDRSRVSRGVLGAGTMSGARLALNGTSVAAPAVARAIASEALGTVPEASPAQGLGLPAERLRQAPVDAKVRVGSGWLIG
jgi:hypothetical protein